MAGRMSRCCGRAIPWVDWDAGVVEGKNEGGDASALHLFVRTIPTVDSDHEGVFTHGLGVAGRTSELFSPLRRQPLGVLRADLISNG
jgi:hypothetical protein